MKIKNSSIQNLIYRFSPIIKFYLRKVGINFTKAYLYSIKLDDIIFKEPKADNIIMKVCGKEDLYLFGKLKDNFLSDILENKILIGAFLNDQWVGYIWISLEYAEVPELERVIKFEGAYLWNLYVKKEYRQNGIAKKLLCFSLNQIKNNYKKKEAYGMIETSNLPSIKSVERNKFSRVGTISFSKFLLWKKYDEKLDNNKIALLEK